MAVRENEPAATSEVAEEVAVASQRAAYRLRQLEADGRVESKRIGNSLAWRIATASELPNEVDPAGESWEAATYVGAKMSVSEVDDVVNGEIETR